MPDTDEAWKKIAQEDPWRIATIMQIQSEHLDDLIATAQLKPVPILASSFDAAKLLHRSSQGVPRARSKSKFDVHNGSFLLTNNHPRFGVTLGSIDRGLNILNFILHHCRRYGATAELDSSQYVSVLHRRSSARLSINERIEEIFVPPAMVSARAKPVAGHRVNRGTGQLSITIYSGGLTRRFVDKGDDTLEKQISKIIARIVQSLTERTAYIDHLDRQIAQSREADRLKAAEVARARALTEQLETMRVAHFARNDELVAEAAEWEQAASIRRYVDHVRAKSESSAQPVDPNLAAWIGWAMGVAESLDPTDQRIGGLPSHPLAIQLDQS